MILASHLQFSGQYKMEIKSQTQEVQLVLYKLFSDGKGQDSELNVTQQSRV